MIKRLWTWEMTIFKYLQKYLQKDLVIDQTSMIGNSFSQTDMLLRRPLLLLFTAIQNVFNPLYFFLHFGYFFLLFEFIAKILMFELLVTYSQSKALYW